MPGPDRRLGAGRGDAGSAVVDFTLVSVLVVALFLLVLQVGFVLHTRNVLISSAQEGARYAANADRTAAEGVARTRQAIADALSPAAAARMTVVPVSGGSAAGAPVVGIEVRGPLPLVFLPAGPLTITVRGHALDEG